MTPPKLKEPVPEPKAFVGKEKNTGESDADTKEIDVKYYKKQRAFFIEKYEQAYERYLEASSRRDGEAKKEAWEEFNRYRGQVSALEEELMKSEECYRSLVELSLDMIALHSRGKYVYVNPAGIKLLGASRLGDLIGKSVFETIHPGCIEIVKERIRQLEQGKGVPLLEEKYIRLDGTIVDVKVAASPIFFQGEPMVQAIARDITELKRAEEAHRGSEEEAKRLAKEAAVLAEIGRIISSTLDIGKVYESFANEAQKLIAFDRISINLTNLEEGKAVVSYVSGLDTPGRRFCDTYQLKDSVTEKIRDDRLTLLIQPETQGELEGEFPKFIPHFQAGLRSMMGVALVSGDAVIGVLYLYSKILRAYTDWDLRLAERIANQIAGAIANAQLFSEHKRTEKTLKESEIRFRDLYDNAPLGYHEYDTEGRITNVNQTDLDMLGYTREEMVGQSMWKFNDDEEMVHQQIKAKLAGKMPPDRSLVRTYRRKDGTTFPVLIEDRLLRDEKGRITGIRCTIQDITERKRAEEALRQSEKELNEQAQELQKSEEKYRSLVENVNEVIFSLDPQGCFTYVSPVIQQVAFYRCEEMIGQPLSRFVYWEDLPEFLRSLKDILSGHFEPHEFRILNKQGNLRHVRVSARVVLEGGEPVGSTGLLIDITDQKLAAALLDRAEAKYRSIFANALEGIFQSTPDGKFIVANPACARILGYDSVEELIIQDPDKPRQHFVELECYRKFQRLLEDQSVVQGYEAQVCRKDGGKIWISINARAMRDPNGVLIFHEGTIEDITEWKIAQDQIRYLSFHDKLTGLFNRAYFEEELGRLDTERQLPISVIMGDANGLKLINDAFGHQEGDKALNQIGKILRECCRKEDVIARWGGDEFIVLLPRTGSNITSEIIHRIKIACNQASQSPVKFSIALGAGTKEGPSQDIQEILKEAEERMYRNKLMESKNVRNPTILSLQRPLFEKSHETEEHAHRLQQLALQFGLALGLSDGEMDELALLATLHDIGKMAILEEIILKPGNLSPKEWELIWRHPEVGYRIAGSSRELAPIVEAILSHHERWDGTGYPRGLKGEETPLLSRIIAIMDAYDAMIYGRPYKEAVSRQKALQELQKEAGSQFDPNLINTFIKKICAC